MAKRILNTGRNIAVSTNNGYTVEKVRKAVDFVKHAKRRSTKLEDYLNMYNYLKGADERKPVCSVCGMTKYIAAVENYAKYGYLTLVASGVDPDILNGLKDGDKEETDTVETQTAEQPLSEGDEVKDVAADDIGLERDEEVAVKPKKKNGVGKNKKGFKK